jgi:hypothetical protein
MLDYPQAKLEKKKGYLVFTKIFNFLGGRSELTHAFFHSFPPFPDFLGQAMHFYKSP